MNPRAASAPTTYTKFIKLILVLGLSQIFVFMPLETKIVDIAALGSRREAMATMPDFGMSLYFKSSTVEQLSDEIEFDLDSSNLDLLYLHVGKTGGMSLDRILKSNCVWRKNEPRKKCYKELLNGSNELLLSKLTKTTLHMTYPSADTMRKLYHSHELLWTLRNPISRMVSAFDMRANHVYISTDLFWGKVFYERCGFRTAQDLADGLDSAKNNTVIQIPQYEGSTKMMNFDCRRFARGTLEGKDYGFMGIGQAKFNYAHYLLVTEVLRDKKNFALRTEHLWDDVIQTNGMLVAANSESNIRNTEDTWISNVRNISSFKMTHGSENYEIKSTLTPRGKELFCCYLSDENQIYENILLSAINLSDHQKAESLQSLYRDCGILPSDSSSVSMIGGFKWQEWRSNGCPTESSLSSASANA